MRMLGADAEVLSPLAVMMTVMRPAMMMKIIIVFFDINVDRLHVPCAVIAHR